MKRKRNAKFAATVGGFARAASLTPTERSESASNAARARWKQRADEIAQAIVELLNTDEVHEALKRGDRVVIGPDRLEIEPKILPKCIRCEKQLAKDRDRKRRAAKA